MSSCSRPPLEVADVFRLSGTQYKSAQHRHLSLAQLKVMSAIERCRSAQLGAHHLHCEHCHTDAIAYNSCRNRHCPKCQGLHTPEQTGHRFRLYPDTLSVLIRTPIPG